MGARRNEPRLSNRGIVMAGLIVGLAGMLVTYLIRDDGVAAVLTGVTTAFCTAAGLLIARKLTERSEQNGLALGV